MKKPNITGLVSVIVLSSALAACGDNGSVGFQGPAGALEHASGKQLVRGLADRAQLVNEEPETTNSRRDATEAFAKRAGFDLSDDLGTILKDNKAFHGVVFTNLMEGMRELPAYPVRVEFDIDGGYHAQLNFLVQQTTMLGFLHVTRLPLFDSGSIKHGDDVLPIPSDDVLGLLLVKDRDALKARSDKSWGTIEARRQAASAAAAATRTNVDIQRLQGIAPDDLLKDPDWGPKLAAITPPSSQQCLKATLSQLPGFQTEGLAAVSAAHGSHAENWITGFIQVSADGNLDVALVCDDASDHILVLTSRGIGLPASGGLAKWLKEQGTSIPVTVTDGKQERQASLAELLGGSAQPTAQTDAPTAMRVHVSGDVLQVQGGVLGVVDADIGKQLVLNHQAVSKVSGDLVSIVDAYRFQGHDVAIVTYACGGSGALTRRLQSSTSRPMVKPTSWPMMS